MSKKQLLRAKRLIEAGQLDTAKAILINVDHPKADEWLIRIERLKRIREKNYTNKLIIAIVLVLFLYPVGLIVTAMFASEAKNYRSAPGAVEMIYLNRFAFFILALPIIFYVFYIFMMILLG